MLLHLDYGDVIYHILAKLCEFSGSIILASINGKPEPVERSAAQLHEQIRVIGKEYHENSGAKSLTGNH